MLHIYKASAGSGKTFALTREYLTLLLGKHDPETGKWTLRQAREDAHRHILAITFTNKATQEMTRRIISQLAILAHREPQHSGVTSPYLKHFIKLFGTDADTLAQLASDMLDELLADFAFFHVSTIDAFFQNVLRIFAREVEMPDNFRLEIDNSATISLGVEEMFKSLNSSKFADPLREKEHEWLTKWLTRLMVRKFETGSAVNLFSRTSSIYADLIKTFNLLLDEKFRSHIKVISEYLDKVERLAAFEAGITKALDAAKQRLVAEAVALKQYGDYQDNVNRFIRGCVDDWAVGNMRAPVKTVIDAIDDDSKRFKAAFFRKGVPQELNDAVKRICANAKDFTELRERTEVLIEAITPLGLLGCLLRHINNFCKDNNVILLSDTNSLLRDIINDDETPFVYERLGYYLHHFLIDEVQDTSEMQWKNLRPLILESLSNNHDNLVIGDEKQCIYRFRNSNPELLGHIISDDINEVYDDQDMVKVTGNSIAHNYNWRSAKEIVRFNNSIFHAITHGKDIARSFSNVIQQIDPSRKDIPGYVKLIFEPDPTGDEKATAAADSGGAAGKEDEEETSFVLQTTVAEVDRMLDAGYRPGQIAILVRTHREGEAVIAELLRKDGLLAQKHANLEVKSTDALGINASPTIRMIIEILRLSQLPHTVPDTRHGGASPSDKRKENPAYRRARLLYCYQYFLHLPGYEAAAAEEGDSYNSIALAKAIETIKNEENATATNATATNATATNGGGNPPGISSLKEILDFASSSTGGSAEGDDNVTCLTLNAIVDKIISRYVSPDALSKETAYITAFQDLVYDFCAQGTSDIRSFLSWWDNGGCRSALSSTSESDAINVVTIHQSKGLEYPCVIIPFCKGKMVEYSTPMRLNYQWMELNAGDFPGIAPEVVPDYIPVKFESRVPGIDIFKQQAERVIDEQYVDNLNVSYVAFTRAVNELVVIVPHSRGDRSGDTDSLATLLRDAVEELTPANIDADSTLDTDSRKWVLPLADIFDGNKLEIGAPTSPVTEVEETDDDDVVTLPSYSPAVNEKLVTLSAADIELFDYDNPRHRGNLLHRVLSDVRHKSDLSRALHRAARRYHLTDAQASECAEILSRAVNDPRVERWFEGYSKLYREQSIATTGTDRRPDRIVILDDGTVEVIDYKFGSDHPSYTRQVRRYMSLLRKAGYTNIKGYLWFVPTMTIRPVH